MKVLIVTSGCNPSGGGFSLRVHSLAQMASKIAAVSVLSTYDAHGPNIPDVRFYHQPFPEGVGSKLSRLLSYYRTDFEKIVIEEKPDIVQIESPALYGLARQFSDTPIILDEHNVWWKLEEYNMQQGPTISRLPVKKPLIKWLVSRAKKYELEALRKSSHVIVCSENDGEEILKELPDLKKRMSYIPNCLDTQRYEVRESANDIVLFMGSLVYFPNIDAVKLICEKIAPRVKAEFHILGEGLTNIGVPPNVKFLGRVDDVRPHVGSAKVCIAPLRYGSGSRLKILEYMATGKPVVSTTKGAEGLDVENGKNILLEDEIEKFADLINGLLENISLRRKMGLEARALIEQKYDYRIYCDRLSAIYSALL